MARRPRRSSSRAPGCCSTPRSSASIYLLFAGHNQPGGGFVGGLVAGSAIALRYLAGGLDAVRDISRFQPWTILGAGVVLAAVTALSPAAARRSGA